MLAIARLGSAAVCCRSLCASAWLVPCRASSGLVNACSRLLQEQRLLPDRSQLAAVRALQALQDSFCADMASRVATPGSSSLVANGSSSTPAVLPPGCGGLSGTASSGKTTAAGLDAVPGPSNNGAANPAQSRPCSSDPSNSSSNPSSSSSNRVRGAYLWGAVGSGKTMLADLFCSTLPNTVMTPSGQQLEVAVRRCHFHEFMQQVHQRQHQLQQALPRVVVKSRNGLPVYRYAEPPQDFLLTVADEVAAQHQLLCLDELHVTDVADAMVLSRLLGALLVRGCWLVFTSNRPAGALYKGGLNRRYLEPFVRLLQEHLLQLKVASGVDYRSLQVSRQQQQKQQVAAGLLDQQQPEPATSAASASQQVSLPGWLQGAGGEQLWNRWLQHLADHHCQAGTELLPLPFGRQLQVPCAATPAQVAAAAARHAPVDTHQPLDTSAATSSRAQPGNQGALGHLGGATPASRQHHAAALFTFEQLCGSWGCSADPAAPAPLSAAEYLAIAQRYRLLFISGIPQLTAAQRDDARRLVTLVDILYDAGCKVVASAAVPVDDLFLPLLAAAYQQGVNPSLGTSQPVSLSKLQSQLERQGPAAGATNGGQSAGQSVMLQEVPHALYAEEVLMYHRAASRLQEMCS